LNLFLDTKEKKDYLIFRNILDSIDIIENYSVLEMTSKRTKIILKYKGKINKLRDRLLKKKIDIKIVDNIWRATIN